MNNDVIYFSVNNWFCGRDYPDTPNFKKWLGNDLKQTFTNDEWCKENKLCVTCEIIDMSHGYAISAPREWVEKNCPELLSDKEYEYTTLISDWKTNGWKEEVHKKKYSDFVYKPEEGEDMPYTGMCGVPFREYKEENFGVEWYEEPYECDDEDEDEEVEEDEDEDEDSDESYNPEDFFEDEGELEPPRKNLFGKISEIIKKITNKI